MNASADTRGVYSIGAVSRMIGVPVGTLRAWEERYDLVRPQRSDGGQRLYSRAEVDQLRFIKDRLEQGLSPAEAHRLLEERLGAPPRRTPAGRGGRRLMILLAERDPYAAELAEYFLHTEGYEVTLSFDIEEARRTFEAVQPDLTVLDWLISGGVGAELCRDLKERSDRPVMVLSTIELREAAIDAGADAYLQKPLEPLSFVSAVKDLVGDSAFARERGGAGDAPVAT